MHRELGFHNHFFSSSLQTKSVFCVTGLHSSFPLGVPLSVLFFFITRNERTLKLFNIFKSLHPFVSQYKRNAFLGILMQTPIFFVFLFFFFKLHFRLPEGCKQFQVGNFNEITDYNNHKIFFGKTQYSLSRYQTAFSNYTRKFP